MSDMQTTIEADQPLDSPAPQRYAKDYAILFLKGGAMGSADVVPGVSGGTMAFILGIYQRLLIRQSKRLT